MVAVFSVLTFIEFFGKVIRSSVCTVRLLALDERYRRLLFSGRLRPPPFFGLLYETHVHHSLQPVPPAKPALLQALVIESSQGGTPARLAPLGADLDHARLHVGGAEPAPRPPLEVVVRLLVALGLLAPLDRDVDHAGQLVPLAELALRLAREVVVGPRGAVRAPALLLADARGLEHHAGPLVPGAVAGVRLVLEVEGRLRHAVLMLARLLAPVVHHAALLVQHAVDAHLAFEVEDGEPVAAGGVADPLDLKIHHSLEPVCLAEGRPLAHKVPGRLHRAGPARVLAALLLRAEHALLLVRAAVAGHQAPRGRGRARAELPVGVARAARRVAPPGLHVRHAVQLVQGTV
mmetsp:Transcript_32346/g.50802  ORF Transcript_32346/g.50802 Transcript_32346/m.50802 type:complete len:348 (-) Transcript_32346:564-1607(-)